MLVLLLLKMFLTIPERGLGRMTMGVASGWNAKKTPEYLWLDSLAALLMLAELGQERATHQVW